MKKLILLGLFLSFSAAYAQTKKEVASMLDKMEASGMVDKAHLKQAREELREMKEEDLKKIIEAGKQMQKDPRVLKKIKEMGLDKAP